MKINLSKVSTDEILYQARKAAGIGLGSWVEHGYSQTLFEKQLKEAVRRTELLGIAKKHQAGIVVALCSGTKVSQSYKWKRVVEVCTIERFPSGWFFTSFSRKQVFPDFNVALEIWLGVKAMNEYYDACKKRDSIRVNYGKL